MTQLPIQFALSGTAKIKGERCVRVVRLQSDPSQLNPESEMLICDTAPNLLPPGAIAVLRSHIPIAECEIHHDQFVHLPPELDYLGDGDVIRINPTANQVVVLYRRKSQHNAILVTEQCNSFCVMCSQPPRLQDDSYLINELLEAIPLMDPSTGVLGITGGEPTLRFKGFLRILSSIKTYLPQTEVHTLSNGRLFAYVRYAQDVANIGVTGLQFGVPLYSDLSHTHDQVVQADGAFDQTIRGILNLARVGVSVEIRVVLHRFTIDRLPDLARFITRNLPFVDHVALMGLEPMGFGKSNLDDLWVDPIDYQSVLLEAVDLLENSGLCVSIYNHQLCTLNRSLWPFAVQSVSDWKRYYPQSCNSCTVREQCGGFFASSVRRMSRAISPIQ